MKQDYHDFNTLLLHGSSDRDPLTGGLSTPIYQVSTFHRDSDKPSKYDYSRSANPTRDVLEDHIAQLEMGIQGFAFSSGMAAISTILLLFSPGDHLVVSKDIYGGAYRLFTQVFNQWQLEVDFVDITNTEEIKTAIKDNTKGIYFEILSNPFLRVADLKTIVDICKQNNLVSIVDNTFLPPYYCRPLEFGADIVLHSATKFLNGHSDVIAGVSAVNCPNLAKRLAFLQNAIGAVLGPQDSWLLLRGMKTLGIRLERQTKSAEEIAKWLSEQPWIKKLYYSGLASHPGKEILDNISSGPGMIITFEVKDSVTKENLMKKLSLPAVAVSLGAVESILTHPATMSHAGMPEEVREAQGITDRIFRFSVGLEHPLDLMNDFSNSIS
ncbi:MAG: cystathionine gamma-synthase [Gracilibacter sp. BRH_c7a]|nr:MAG: cystathionine gamma-synthase [Gracilibacter sp. BRH_c7a]